MKITKQTDGNIEIDLDADELYLFGQALNECWGGFVVDDYEATLGIDKAGLQKLLDQVVSMYPWNIKEVE